jgi:hypothetical protein
MSFEEVGTFSAVTKQPTGDGHIQQAYQALLACPVGSIGTEQSDKLRMKEAMVSFPLQLEGEVSYCGFNSEKSFGANSFFIEHPDGNWHTSFSPTKTMWPMQRSMPHTSAQSG